jgi:hypothetical protein
VKTRRSWTQFEATAYHEAGHAIAAWKLESRVFRVTLEPDEDSLGKTFHSNPLTRVDFDDIEFGPIAPRCQRRAENVMIISLAGPAAQHKYNPRSVRLYHGGSDRENVYEILSHLCEITSDIFPTYYHLMDLQARALVRNPVNWRAIEILAQELLQRRTIPGKRLRRFIISRCFALSAG